MLKYKVDSDIELKLPNINDAQNFYKLIDSSREHLSTWLPWIASTNSVNDVLPFIKGAEDEFALGKGLKAILVYQGEYAGLIGFNNIDLSRKSVSIGYWLGEPYQSMGIMTKALKVFIDYALNDMRLNKVEISIAEENFKSRALPKKYGFKEEGIIRDAEWLNDKYVNHILYGLLKSEWKS